jgi:hypothetical protein
MTKARILADFISDGSSLADGTISVAEVSGAAPLASPTFTGTVVATSLDISGDIDVDGTTNLDVVDIDGAVDMASTLLVTGVLTTTAATVFNGGFAANAASTIATTDNSVNLTLTSTDADASGGPQMHFYRNSASPAAGDVLTQIEHLGKNDAGETVAYMYQNWRAAAVGDGVESGQFDINTYSVGTAYERLGIDPTETVFNQDHADLDFRVESDTKPHAFFVEGDNTSNRLKIGMGTGTITNPYSQNNFTDVNIDGVWGGAISFKLGGTVMGFAGQRSSGNGGMAVGASSGQELHIISNGVLAQHIDTSGNIIIANTGGTLYTTTAGTSNLRLGVNAGNSIASGGIQNVCVGDEAGTAITTGDYNTAVGYKALYSDTLGNRSTAIGREALLNQNFTSDTDAYNIAVGYGAGLHNLTGYQNTFLGAFTGYYGTTTNGSTFVGYAAGFGNDGSPLTGNNNTAVGYQAGGLLQGGATENVLVGAYAGDAITTGSENVCVGLGAGGGITTGTRNTCIGDDAGNTITTATRSIAIGHLAMGVTAVTGTGNVAIGFQTGYAMLAGAENVMIGEYAGAAITSGSRNTCVGINSGNATTTAVDNVFLGTQAGTYEVGTTTGSYNTIVGGYCHTSAVDSIQQIVMGHNVTGNGNNTLCFGNATTDSSIAFGATSITAPSDQRYKEEIADATAGLSFIKDLRPVTFKWKKEKDVPSDHPAYVEGSDKRVMESNGETNHGFIAQEVKAVIDNHPEIKDGFAMWSEQGLDENGNSTGGRQRLGEGALIPILVKAIQELEARLAVLEG